MTTDTVPTATATIPDVESYLRVHRALRASAAQLAAAAAKPADRRTAKARCRWYKGFADEIRSHHEIEDVLLFPAIAARVATYPELAPRLDGDHADLDVLLDDLATAFGANDHVSAGALAAALRDHLDEHLDFEDAEIAPLFVRHFTSAEYEELNARALKMTTPRQLLFTAPWMMAHLDAAEQRELLASVPKAMTVLWIATRGRYARLASRALD